MDSERRRKLKKDNSEDFDDISIKLSDEELKS